MLLHVTVNVNGLTGRPLRSEAGPRNGFFFFYIVGGAGKAEE